MLKRVIAVLVLLMYLHGMSGYTMSIHTCMITGSENVYTTFGKEDPCEEEERHCEETEPHFEQADCCDLQQTVINVEDDSNISSFPLNHATCSNHFTYIRTIPYSLQTVDLIALPSILIPDPPDLSEIRVFRI